MDTSKSQEVFLQFGSVWLPFYCLYTAVCKLIGLCNCNYLIFSYHFVSAYCFSQGWDKYESFSAEDIISLRKIFLSFFKEKMEFLFWIQRKRDQTLSQFRHKKLTMGLDTITCHLGWSGYTWIWEYSPLLLNNLFIFYQCNVLCLGFL